MFKINIIGDGVFGSFLKDLLKDIFDICDSAESVILAVPLSAYDELGKKYKDKHLINVCSVQEPSTNILLKYTNRVTSIHPLFGKRTPESKRNSILTRLFDVVGDDGWFIEGIEKSFISNFLKVSDIVEGFTPAEHDKLMAKTHLVAVKAAQQAKILLEGTEKIEDKLIPNSFRLLREFVKTLDDMPAGTLESIKANQY